MALMVEISTFMKNTSHFGTVVWPQFHLKNHFYRGYNLFHFKAAAWFRLAYAVVEERER